MARTRALHRWDLTPTEAVELQRQMRDQLIIEAPTEPIRTIAGMDMSFDKGSPRVFSGIVVLELPSFEVVEEVGIESVAQFPYIPGLLSFREAPSLLEAWDRLRVEPDAVMVDGHGYAHPRRFGIASHLGTLLDRPTVGCAKSVLVGSFDPPGDEPGSWSPLIHKGEIVGAALRTREGVSPIFVTVGAHIDLPSAIELTMRCAGRYRIPEPTRRAHLLVNALRRGERPDLLR